MSIDLLVQALKEDIKKTSGYILDGDDFTIIMNEEIKQYIPWATTQKEFTKRGVTLKTDLSGIPSPAYYPKINEVFVIAKPSKDRQSAQPPFYQLQCFDLLEK